MDEPKDLLKRVGKLTDQAQRLMDALDELKKEGPQTAHFAQGVAALLRARLDTLLSPQARADALKWRTSPPEQVFQGQPGDRFGEIVLVEYLRGGYWRCECKLCGRFTVLKGSHLPARKNPSCGCRTLTGDYREPVEGRPPPLRRPIQPGEKFGELEAIKVDSSNKWQLRCRRCETFIWLSASALRNRVNPTCGCLSLAEAKASGLPMRKKEPTFRWRDGKWTKLQRPLDVASDEELNEGDET